MNLMRATAVLSEIPSSQINESRATPFLNAVLPTTIDPSRVFAISVQAYSAELNPIKKSPAAIEVSFSAKTSSTISDEETETVLSVIFGYVITVGIFSVSTETETVEPL